MSMSTSTSAEPQTASIENNNVLNSIAEEEKNDTSTTLLNTSTGTTNTTEDSTIGTDAPQKKRGPKKGTKYGSLPMNVWYDACRKFEEGNYKSQKIFLESGDAGEFITLDNKVTFSHKLKQFREGKLQNSSTRKRVRRGGSKDENQQSTMMYSNNKNDKKMKIDSSSKNKKHANKKQAVQTPIQAIKAMTNEVNSYTSEIACLTYKKECRILTKECFKFYCSQIDDASTGSNTNLSFWFSKEGNAAAYQAAGHIYLNKNDVIGNNDYHAINNPVGYFNTCLQKVGLPKLDTLEPFHNNQDNIRYYLVKFRPMDD